MATRMQQRRGTASQWTSANPVLNAGEIGWESDTNKFKIGDGTNHWADIDYFADINSTVNPSFGSSITFEGATADSYETVLQVTDPTADRTITFPNATGTVVLADGSGNVTVSGDLTVSGTTTTINSTTINATTGIIFEGLTADAHETTLTVTDPTADRTITFPDATGTVQLRVADVDDTEIGYLNGVTSAIQTQLNDKLASTTASTTYAPLANPTFTGTVVLPANTISQSMMGDDSVGTNEIGGLAVTTGKIADLAVTEGKLADGAITNAKVSASAAIAQSKIDGLTTDLGLKAPLESPAFTGTVALTSTVNGPSATTSVNLLSTSSSANITLGANQTSGNLTIGGGSARTTGILGIGTGQTASGTKTINIGTASTGGTTAITIGSSSGATSNITLNGTVTAANNLVVTGDLTVNGTTTTINSTTLAVDDKNITLGDVATPSDTTADGGGITLKGLTDKTFNWLDATDSWTSSEHINLASGKSYYMNGTLLKDVSETLTNKTLSSATLTGTLTAGGGAGTAGQILKSTGTGVEWGAAASGGAAFSEFMLIGA